MIDFQHSQSAHCESGVSANMVSHYAKPLSEAMAFGIGGGLFFGYFPFVRVNKLPLVTFRTAPGSIFKNVGKRLNLTIEVQQFRSKKRAEEALDRSLDQGIPVVLQTGVYWLPYFPPALRFHFNAHNLVVYGRKGDEYYISDPVFEEPVCCLREDLTRARFAAGALAPKGKMSTVSGSCSEVDLSQAIVKGIREVGQRMYYTPVPVMGYRGINFLANRLEKWPNKLGLESARQHLGHVIRMQEEIGTGGGGFRFIYAAFLQEASDVLGKPQLKNLADEMTEIGDMWRYFALLSARNCKGREGENSTFPALANLLRQCARREKALFSSLLKAI